MKINSFIFFILSIIPLTILGQKEYRYELKNLIINNEHSSFGMTFIDDNTFIFSGSEYGKSYNFYKSYVVGIGENHKYELYSKSLQNDKYDTNITFTKDRKTMYFTRSHFGKTNSNKKNTRARLAIYRMKKQDNGEWGELKPMPFNSHKYDVAHPTLSADGKRLYFSSNMPGTLGDTDIFVVDVLNDGNYSKPRNLGDKVNTAKKEQFPFISDDDYLYFSSTGHKDNYGGLDIYYVKINGISTSKVIHFEDPINSKWDDFSYITKPKAKNAYISSNRPGGKGQDDIYIVYKVKIKDELKASIVEDCNQYIYGIAHFNNDINKVIPNATVKLFDSYDNQLENVQARANGKFRFTVNCNQNYTIKAVREDFKEGSIKITTSLEKNKKNIANIELIKKTAEEQNLKYETAEGTITFNVNDNELRKENKYKLDLAAQIMYRNPKLIIEIESHTDSRGNDKDNLELTKKRVDVIKRFLVSCGVDSDRVKTFAYGESKPLNKCKNGIKCTEKEYLKNRRTTYKLK